MQVLQQAVAQAAERAVAAGGACQASVVSPMPGKLLRVLVAPGQVLLPPSHPPSPFCGCLCPSPPLHGQAVKAGEPLVVLEAMKMEHTLRADADATVDKTFGREGEVVGSKAVLVTFADTSSCRL